MTTQAQLALYGWVPFTIFLFFLMKPNRALLLSSFAGFLFLPWGSVGVPLLSTFYRTTAVSFGLVAGICLFQSGRLAKIQPSAFDIPMAVYCLVQMPSSISNDLGAYDGVKQVLVRLCEFGIPYIAGRCCFVSDREQRELLLAFLIGGLVYVPLCLFEVRMSPRLHSMTYGYHAHGIHVRFGGWQPLVYLQSGIAVGLFMSDQAINAYWMWRSRLVRSAFGIPFVFIVVLLFVTTLLVKCLSAIIVLFVGLALYTAVRSMAGRTALLCIILLSPAYIGLRLAGVLDREALVDLILRFDEERAESLGYRLRMEEHFSDHAWHRPLLGWGGNGGHFPRMEDGQLVGAMDGFWLEAFGVNGLVGLLSGYGLWLVAPVALIVRIPRREWFRPECVPVTTLAVMTGLHAFHSLFNDTDFPVYTIACGAVVSYAMASDRTKAGDQSQTTNIPVCERTARHRLTVGSPGTW